MKKLYSNKLVILSLVLPGLLLFLFAILAPICLSVYYSVTNYTGMGSFDIIGLENYKTLLHDTAFLTALKNSLLLAIGFICIQHPLALITAAVLDKLGGKAEGFFRCVYFIPNVISVAVIAYLWKFIYTRTLVSLITSSSFLEAKVILTGSARKQRYGQCLLY